MKNITIFRDSLQGYLYYKFNGKDTKLKVEQGNVFKIEEKDFDGTILSRIYEFNFYEIPTEDGIRTFMFTSVSTNTVRSGSGARTGVSILDEGTSVGFAQNINFTGAGVTVTFTNGQATVNIPDGGSGMIGGGGTLNYIPKFTPDGSTLGNSLLFDNGTSVLFGGTAAINSAGFAMTSTTQGFLAPRMTTAERNAIVAPATGLLVYVTSTSLFSYWDGAAWQNIDSQAGGDVSGSGITGNIPYWTDGPNSVLGDTGIPFGNVYVQGGNSFGATARLGTNDLFALEFETNNTLYGTIGSTGLWSIGTVAPIANTRLTVTGTNTIVTTWALRVYNSTPTEIFSVYNSGQIYAGDALNNLMMGRNSGLNLTNAQYNTAFGVEALQSVTGGAGFDGFDNDAFGYQALKSNTTGRDNVAIGNYALLSNTTGATNVAVGGSALYACTIGLNNTAVGNQTLRNLTTGTSNTVLGNKSGNSMTVAEDNTAVGHLSLFTVITGNRNTAVGVQALNLNTADLNTAIGHNSGFKNSTGEANVYMGYQAGFGNTTGSYNVIIGRNAMIDNVGGNNTVVGSQAGFSQLVGTDNVFIGTQAGFYETSSNRLFIDNQIRASLADSRVKSLIYGEFATTTAAQNITFNSHVLIREDLQFTTKAIDTTAGDAATINSPAGRFRKDTSGSTFVLTNSYITANSIIQLTCSNSTADAPRILSVVAGAGTATITFWLTILGVMTTTAPGANSDVDFLVIN